LPVVSSAQLKKFRWGVTSLSASQWILWIAKDARLYERHGLEAELEKSGFIKSLAAAR
jgi:hypothetical protein